jgi:hypothetical protein
MVPFLIDFKREHKKKARQADQNLGDYARGFQATRNHAWFCG